MPIGVVSDADFEKELNNVGGAEDGHADDLSPVHRPDSLGSDIPTEPTQEIAPTGLLTTIEPLVRRGRSEGDNNVPDSLRKIIADEALMNGRSSAIKLATQFGISPSSVSAYSAGATSTTTYNSPSKSLIGHINKSREKAIKRASKTLNAALSAITQDKLDYADASDLSGIAKDMSVIIKNLEPKSVESDTPDKGPQFVIFAPSFRDERTFETIQVKE